MHKTDAKSAQPRSAQPKSVQPDAFWWRPTAGLVLSLHGTPAGLSAARVAGRFVIRMARAK